MSHEAIIRIEQGRAVARTAHDAETLSEMEGGEYRAVFTSPRGRSLSQMALFWVFCGVIADNYPGDVTKEAVAQVLKLEAGAYTVIQLADKTYVRVPKSIAFNAMEPEVFTKFMDRAFAAAAAKFGAELTEAGRDEMYRISTPMLQRVA